MSRHSPPLLTAETAAAASAVRVRPRREPLWRNLKDFRYDADAPWIDSQERKEFLRRLFQLSKTNKRGETSAYIGKWLDIKYIRDRYRCEIPFLLSPDEDPLLEAYGAWRYRALTGDRTPKTTVIKESKQSPEGLLQVRYFTGSRFISETQSFFEYCVASERQVLKTDRYGNHRMVSYFTYGVGRVLECVRDEKLRPFVQMLVASVFLAESDLKGTNLVVNSNGVFLIDCNRTLDKGVRQDFRVDDFLNLPDRHSTLLPHHNSLWRRIENAAEIITAIKALSHSGWSFRELVFEAILKILLEPTLIHRVLAEGLTLGCQIYLSDHIRLEARALRLYELFIRYRPFRQFLIERGNAAVDRIQTDYTRFFSANSLFRKQSAAELEGAYTEINAKYDYILRHAQHEERKLVEAAERARRAAEEEARRQAELAAEQKRQAELAAIHAHEKLNRDLTAVERFLKQCSARATAKKITHVKFELLAAIEGDFPKIRVALNEANEKDRMIMLGRLLVALRTLSDYSRKTLHLFGRSVSDTAGKWATLGSALSSVIQVLYAATEARDFQRYVDQYRSRPYAQAADIILLGRVKTGSELTSTSASPAFGPLSSPRPAGARAAGSE